MPAAPQNPWRRPFLAEWPRAVFFLVVLLGAVGALAQRPLGVDVASYEGGSINWATVKSSNSIVFAWTKATEGVSFTDADFSINEVNAKSAGVLIGAYHFARPELHLGLAGADQEAAHFWSVAANDIKGTNVYLMPMLDVESDLSTASPAYTKITLSQWVNRWCQDVVSAAASNGVAVKPVVYVGVSYASTWLNSTVTNWPLWMASWQVNANPQTGAPSGTDPWPTWAVWQYTDSNTVAGPVHGWDADVVNGSGAALTNLAVGAPIPPFFMTPLVNSRAADAGASVQFAVQAAGSLPLKYQWYFNGVNLPGATNATLVVSNVQAANAGNYSLVVTNAVGSLASKAVALVVYPLEATVFADALDASAATNWVLSESSTDTVATFGFDYSTLGIPAAPNTKNGTTRGLQMKANLSKGVTAALSVSPTNQSFAGDYRLHFDAWINVNGPYPNGGQGSTEFLTGGLGTAGGKTEWTGGTSADGYYFGVDGDGGFTPSNAGLNDYSVFSGAAMLAATSGAYRAGTDATARGADNVYYQAVFTNARTAPLTQRSTYPQQTDALDPGTFGMAWHDVLVARRGNLVDWAVDGVLLATISNAVFTASNVFVGFWDPYPSLSSNNVINFGLVDNVRVEVPAIGPLITTNPVSQVVKLGASALFTAAAKGLPAPNYQWRLNGTNILGATNASYALAFVAATNAGNYTMAATNLAGAAVSSNAALAIAAPVAAQFQAIAMVDGAVQISFTGDAYWTYTIEASTDLVTWTTFTNLTSANGRFNFQAGNVSAAPQQFFRAKVGP